MTTEQRNEVSTEQEISRREERRTLDAVYWGGVLIWAGLVFWADGAGLLPQIAGAQAWDWIFLGAGAYGLLLSFVRLASPNFSNPTAGDYIWAGIFLLIGLGGLASSNIAWPLIVVLIGLAILGGALLRRA